MARDPGIAAHPLGPGTLLQLIREADGTTRADLSALTGLARSTIAQRLDQLRAQGLLRELGESDSTGGRPPMMLAFNEDAGVVLAADLGATHSRLAVTNLGGTVLAEDSGDMAIAAGPEAVLDWADERFHRLLGEIGRDDADVRGIGIGVPGPVEHATGRPRNPPIMPGWDGYPIPERFADRYRVPVLVDNDVNIMALGEHWTNWREVDHLLFVKVATGIGCGIVVDGAHPPRRRRRRRRHRPHPGRRRGGRGDHLQLRQRRLPRGARRRRGDGPAADAGEGSTPPTRARWSSWRAPARPPAVQLVRESGRLIGEVLAASVNLYNPSVIVIGGDVAQAHEQLLAGVREVVYQRSLPLATRHLRVVRSQLADRAGVIGAAVMVIEQVLSPAAIDAAIASAPPGERGLAEAQRPSAEPRRARSRRSARPRRRSRARGRSRGSRRPPGAGPGAAPRRRSRRWRRARRRRRSAGRRRSRPRRRSPGSRSRRSARPRCRRSPRPTSAGRSRPARRSVPASAPAQTAISSAVASGPSITRSANGVTVPAIRKKIIVWSSRRIQRRAAGRFQSTRW